MAKGFNGSVVLTVDSGGVRQLSLAVLSLRSISHFPLQHCSPNVPSVCAQRYVQQYFQDGTLPEPDTVCEPILKNPFLPATAGQEDPTGIAAEEARFRADVMELSQKLVFSLPLHL